MVNEKGSVNLNNDEIDIIDLLKLLYRHKVFIVIVTVLFAAARVRCLQNTAAEMDQYRRSDGNRAS